MTGRKFEWAKGVTVKPYGIRDRAVVRVANLVLSLASKRYRVMVAGATEYGLRAAAQDAALDRPAPPDWRPAPRPRRTLDPTT